MYGEKVMNPANYSCYENQTGQDNKKPFYYLFKPDFFLSFSFNLLLQF
jgi:hypothetical protein